MDGVAGDEVAGSNRGIEAFLDASSSAGRHTPRASRRRASSWDAWMAWRYLALDFSGLRDTTGCETKASGA